MELYRFNTASGKYCCNWDIYSLKTGNDTSFNTASGKYCCNLMALQNLDSMTCFNTASGKYCCNKYELRQYTYRIGGVSIPQAVSTVATILKNPVILKALVAVFQYRKR